MAGITIGMSVILAIAIYAPASGDSSVTSSAWLTLISTILGLIHRAALTASVAGDAGVTSANLTIGLYAAALTGTALVVTSGTFAARKSERVRRSPSVILALSRIVISAAVYAIVMAIITAVSRSALPLTALDDLVGADVNVGVHPFAMLGWSFLLVAVAGIVGRWATIRDLLPTRARSMVTDLAPAIIATTRILVVGAAVVFAAGIISIIVQVIGGNNAIASMADTSNPVSIVFIALAFLINLLLIGVAWFGGASIQVGTHIPSNLGSIDSSFSTISHALPSNLSVNVLATPDLPVFLRLMPLVMAIVVVAVSAWGALRLDPREAALPSIARQAGVMVICLLLVAWLTRFAASLNLTVASSNFTLANLSVKATAHVGLSPVTVVLLALVWTGLAAAGRYLVAPALAGSFPAWFTLRAAKGMHPVWSAQLADAQLRRGVTPPSWQTDTAQDLASQGIQVTALRDRRAGVRIVGIVIGAMAFLIVVYTVVVGVLASLNSPKAVVQDYVDALGRGDLPAIQKQVGALPDSPLMTADVAKKAARPLEGVSISEESRGKNSATYSLRYQRDGETEITRIELFKTTSGPFSLVPKWRISANSAVGELRVPDVALTVNGVSVSPHQNNSFGMHTLAVVPGNYQVEIAATPLINQASDTVTVYPQSTTEATLIITQADGIETAVSDAIKQQLTSCLASTTIAASKQNCPNMYFWYTDDDVSDVKWELTKQPEVKVRLVDISQASFSGEVELTMTCNRKATQWTPARPCSPDQNPRWLSGTATVKNGKLAIDLDE